MKCAEALLVREAACPGAEAERRRQMLVLPMLARGAEAERRRQMLVREAEAGCRLRLRECSWILKVAPE